MELWTREMVEKSSQFLWLYPLFPDNEILSTDSAWVPLSDISNPSLLFICLFYLNSRALGFHTAPPPTHLRVVPRVQKVFLPKCDR